MPVEERVSPGHVQPPRDFSSLHGFQFVGAKDGPSGGEASEEELRRTALALELDARAARFHQAVDSSIVLASDGTIRWLGDSIAKLAPGDDVLVPRTILLADPALSDDAQKTVLARLDLWLNATVQRLLGPLFALRTLQDGSRPLQDLAVKIANAFGVLEREPVRGVVRGLDQTSRAVLRKHGVRFGSFYLYVPSTLRPAARALALQLSCIRKGDEDFSAAAQGLIPMASSGRTSAPPDARVNAETYRIGGFRPCGDRVVRVDIVERLADMIRAGSVLRVVGSDSGPAAFQVTSQMTSLTGCSGDGFSSILRALGFESLTVRRSEIVWPAAAAPVAAPGGDTAAAPHQAVEVASDGDGAEAESTISVAADELPADPSGEVASPTDGDDAISETDGLETETAADHSADEAPSEAEPASEEVSPSAAAPEPDVPPGEPTEASSEIDASSSEHQEAEIEGVAVDAPAEAAQQSAEDETVTIWRFVRLPAASQQRHPRSFRRKPPVPAESRAHQPPGAPEAAGDGAPAEVRPPDPRVPREKRPGSFEKPFHGKRKVAHAETGQRPPQDKREGRAGQEGRSGSDRKPTVDPMSPFAKLMELRSLLEAESKKRK